MGEGGGGGEGGRGEGVGMAQSVMYWARCPARYIVAGSNVL